MDRVLTVNFDPMVVQACALMGGFQAVYDFATTNCSSPPTSQTRPCSISTGNAPWFRLLHTKQELKKHPEGLAPVFEDAGRGRMWIVVGYSGENDPVFDHLAAIPKFDYGLYWITYQDEELASQVCERLLQTNKHAFYIKGYDADGFFVKLAQGLGYFPPDLFAGPSATWSGC